MLVYYSEHYLNDFCDGLKDIIEFGIIHVDKVGTMFVPVYIEYAATEFALSAINISPLSVILSRTPYGNPFSIDRKYVQPQLPDYSSVP